MTRWRIVVLLFLAVLSAGVAVDFFVVSLDGDELSTYDEIFAHESSPLQADTDGDGLRDHAEILVHASDPTTADTDDDGLDDAAEITRHGTDPASADTDDDDIGDDREVSLDTSSTAADTDRDGLDDARELERGTSPVDADTDNDWLRDAWEVDGEAPNGLAIPDSDPLHRDLYLDFASLEDAESISDDDVAFVRREFARMPVENPDGETGITVHTHGPRRANVSLQDLRTLPEYDTDGIYIGHLGTGLYTDEQMGDRRGIHHLVAILPTETQLRSEDTKGVMGIGDHKIASYKGVNRRGMVHELLHTIVGKPFGPDCNGSGHSCEGYLSYTDDEFFSDGTTAWLQNNSYSNNAARLNGELYS